MAQRVRYPDHIEPPVEFVQETTPERIVAATHDKLAAGTTVKDMLLASGEEIESSIGRLPVGERLPAAGLASWRSTDEVKHVAALAQQQYADKNYAPEALIDVLAKIACRDNFTEMHAFKHHQATYEEFYATRPSLRGRHLVAAVQASAISHGRIQDVFDHAAEVMHF
jgi:hypothetical protein